MLQSNDKRRHLRYQVLDFAAAHIDGQDEPMTAIVVDIGLGGLQLRSKTPLPEGKRAVLTVGRIDGDPFVIRGEIVHTVHIEETNLFGCGVRFIPDTHTERLAIAELVHTVFQRQCETLTG